jgi:zinc protease
MRRGHIAQRGFGLLVASAGALLSSSALAAPAPHGRAAVARPGSAAEVTRATLPNGLRVVIVRDTLAPVVTTEMNYLAGSDEAPDGLPGTAHAVEHMMFRGSPGLNKDQISALAANMGGNFNADTTESVTQYFFTVPAQDLDIALHIHAIRMSGVDMAPAEWANERGAIEQEVSRDLSNPTFNFYTELRSSLFAGTPYAHTPLGTRPSFDKTTAEDLKRFHDIWYVPNNAILVIAGNVDPEATLAKVRALFSPIPAKPLPPRPSFTLQPVQARTLTLPSDFPYGLALISFRMPSLHDPDYATAMVLSQAMGSKRAQLFEMGLTGKALFGGFTGDFLPQGGFGYAIGVYPRDGKPEPVLQNMRGMLADAATHGVPTELVEAAKRKSIADLEYEKNSVDGLANAWSRALAFADQPSPDAIKAAIAAVTPAQVDALARQLFDPTHEMTAILTPQNSGQPTSSKGFGGAESFSGQPNGPVTLPDWAQAAFAKLPLPQTAIHPVDFHLANGLRVIVQPENVSKTVQVFGKVKANQDLQAPVSPADQEGVADVLGGMFSFGTTHLDRQHFEAALDAISAHEEAGESFSLAVPAANFEAGMRLLADNELHPAMPQAAFDVIRQREAAAAAGSLKSPDFINELALGKALLPANDPQLRYPTGESIGGLKLADVQNYYSRVYRPDMTTIVIVGNVTPAEARRVAEQTFGAWKASGPKPQTDYSPVPPNPAATQFNTPDPTAVQDSVTMAQQVQVTNHSDARFALNAGNMVLSGGFYAARLTRDLREQRGLVYTVDSRFDLDRHRGRFLVEYGSDPDKVGQAHDLVVRDLKAMADAPISASDLHQAKGMLIRQLLLGESSFDGIASRLLQYSLQDKPLDSDLIGGRRYTALTAPQIQAAFRTYIRPDAFVTAVQGPPPK